LNKTRYLHCSALVVLSNGFLA